MKKEVEKVITLWKKSMTENLKGSKPVPDMAHIGKIASLFASGNFYYFIFNWHTTKMEFVDPNIKNVIGVDPIDWNERLYLDIQTEESLRQTQKKEEAVGHYVMNVIPPEQLQDYKSSYFVTFITPEGEEKRILHQSTTLTLSDNHVTERVLCIHTDVSHLRLIKDESVSMIGMNGRKSYYNIDEELMSIESPDQRVFNISRSSLSNREKEIIKYFSKGETAKEIAERIDVKENTVRTHRQRILEKTGCRNTTELVTKCLIRGII